MGAKFSAQLQDLQQAPCAVAAQQVVAFGKITRYAPNFPVSKALCRFSPPVSDMLELKSNLLMQRGSTIMSLEQIIQETKGLSANYRALLAHELISSLETQHDEGVDAA